ncbi:MAG TPA: N-acetyl-gamma-glutamyl-phosphate reductase [Chitinivibrionales bacterium]|nr:N-acetyl-gamma-glutamyl-phosphate reductase [Chitinivibrionales bacterium]
MSKKINVGILGATGYTGIELVKLFASHPFVHIAFVSSQSYAGQKLSAVFPQTKGVCDDVLMAPDKTFDTGVDCVFSCLPHATSAGMLMPFITRNVRVVDLSADFRIKDPKAYEQWYKTEHPCPELLEDAVFGLCEHYRDRIAKAKIVANPGCYSSSIMLPLLPLFKHKAVQLSLVIADSKSGVSGAGRSLKLTSHFAEVHENFSAYAIGHAHRHIAEIEQEFSIAAKKPVTITFSPHLLPTNRGILSTIYLCVNKTAAECLDIVKNAYENEPFIRMREPQDLPCIAGVAHTNFCDITFTDGENGRPVIAVSALDNLVKGASGQAVQNMNIMFGFPETTGLL